MLIFPIGADYTEFTKEEKEHIAQEMADVLIYLTRLAEKCHIDLPKAATDKMHLNSIKYPVHLVKGSSKYSHETHLLTSCRKYTEYNQLQQQSSQQ